MGESLQSKFVGRSRWKWWSFRKFGTRWWIYIV
nr:MAG TPA: hypothetical protein [Caudoviricetes sp.]